MPKLGSIIVALFLLTFATRGVAQADITKDTKASSDDIQRWLRSGDPHQMAWGAYFARENQDSSAIPLMGQYVSNWTPPQYVQDPEINRLKFAPVGAMMDALTQLNATLPANVLAVLASIFPVQAAILANRLPTAEATPLLLSWYNQRTRYSPPTVKDDSQLVKIAAMMLAHAPPPGFAASIVRESQETLNISVESATSGGRGYGTGTGNPCGDSFGRTPKPGWPPSITYIFEENNPQSSALVTEVAGDRITYARIDLDRGWGTCSYVQPLSADTRHHIIAQMLGLGDDALPWKTMTDNSILWKSNQQYVRDLKTEVASEEAKLRETVEALQAKGFLTADEARDVRPQLSGKITDNRKPAEPPLPRLSFRDPHTFIAQ
jgi:hypothetical protein